MKKNLLHKIISITFSVFFLVGLIIPIHSTLAQNTTTPGTTTTPTSAGTYKYLAPLDTTQSTFDPAQANALSIYLNTIIKVLISVAAVLAMIMIVMGGIEYMTSDIVSKKTEGKKRIINAIIGLLIALASYLLLFTINPDLLKTIDANTIPTTFLELEEAPPTAADYQPINTTPIATIDRTCSAGVTRITSGGQYDIRVCSSLATNLQALLNLAWSKGIRLGGWGWRSYAKQVELRTTNGCPNIYTSPASACRVPTAIPGTSMHEQGLAIDFTCGGVTIKARSGPCYDFLVQYAGSVAGLQILKSGKEAWHWSINGK